MFILSAPFQQSQIYLLQVGNLLRLPAFHLVILMVAWTRRFGKMDSFITGMSVQMGWFRTYRIVIGFDINVTTDPYVMFLFSFSNGFHVVGRRKMTSRGFMF